MCVWREQELEESSCKQMQPNQRFRFPCMYEQVLNKAKHISSGSPTADISIVTVPLPMSSHVSNNLWLKMTFLMLKKNNMYWVEERCFLSSTYQKLYLYHWLPTSDPCLLSSWDTVTHMHTSSSLKQTCSSLKVFASLNWSFTSRINATYL